MDLDTQSSVQSLSMKRVRRRGRHGQRRAIGEISPQSPHSPHSPQSPMSPVSPARAPPPPVPVLEAFGLTPSSDGTQSRNVVTWGDLDKSLLSDRGAVARPSPAAAGGAVASASASAITTIRVGGTSVQGINWAEVPWSPLTGMSTQSQCSASAPAGQGSTASDAGAITSVQAGGVTYQGINWAAVQWDAFGQSWAPMQQGQHRGPVWPNQSGDWAVHLPSALYRTESSGEPPADVSSACTTEWTHDHSNALRDWLVEGVSGGKRPSHTHVEEMLRTSVPETYED